MSKLFRNVPFLSSLEMSPFSVLVLRSFVEFGNLLWPSSFVSWPLFSFLVPIPVFLEKIPRQDALGTTRSEEHTSELQSRLHLVCRLLLEKKKHTTSFTAAINATHRQLSAIVRPSADFLL